MGYFPRFRPRVALAYCVVVLIVASVPASWLVQAAPPTSPHDVATVPSGSRALTTGTELFMGPIKPISPYLAPSGPSDPDHTSGDLHAHDGHGHSHGDVPLRSEAAGGIRSAVKLLYDFTPNEEQPPFAIERAPAWTEVYRNRAATNHDQLEFRCPSVAENRRGNFLTPELVVYGCPFRIYDNSWSFGNADIAVLESDPRHVAFVSLHGPGHENTETGRGRHGYTHTTFTSNDQGLWWSDQFTGQFHTPGGAGEEDAITMDAEGHIYTAMMWQGIKVPWTGKIRLAKGPSADDTDGMRQAYNFAHEIQNRTQGGLFRDVGLVYIPDPAAIADEDCSSYTNTTECDSGNTTRANVTQTDPSVQDQQAGNATVQVNMTPDRVVATWHEALRDENGEHYAGFIDAAWTHTGTTHNWTRLDWEQLIGPCRDASDPVVYETKVYVACSIDYGYTERSRARVEDIDIWSMDPQTGKTEFVSHTGLAGTNLTLATARDGYMMITTYKQLGEQDNNLRAAFGWHGKHWRPVQADLGGMLHQLAGERPMRDSHVTALAITEEQRIGFLIYQEWHNDTAAEALPEWQPGTSTPTLQDFTKIILTFNECDGYLAAQRLDLGTGVDPWNYQYFRENPAIFNDARDGIQVIREPTGAEVAYFAVNDYGSVQFGGVVSNSVGSPCAVPPPPPPIPGIVVPQALTYATPFNSALGAGVGLVSSLMIGYLLAVKRKTAHALSTEA